MSQLLDSQLKLDEGHQQRGMSKMLKDVVTNMHCLIKFSREAGLTPYLGANWDMHTIFMHATLRVRCLQGAHFQSATYNLCGLVR